MPTSWNSGWRVLFDPGAVVVHAGGMSAPRADLVPILASSRLIYARKHCGPMVANLHRVGIAIGAALRVVISRADSAHRSGQARAFWRLCTGRLDTGATRPTTPRTARAS